MIWGKVLGASFGFMLGGPFGALLGAYIGHNFDRGINQGQFGFANSQEVQDKFFISLFQVMGHITKADGHVSEQEIQMARMIMAQMRLSEERKAEAIELFNRGKQPEFDLDHTLRVFKQACHGNRNLMQMFLEIQIAAAYSDGNADLAEMQILENIARVMG
jgi:DnaJ like chaperone protein